MQNLLLKPFSLHKEDVEQNEYFNTSGKIK